MLCRGGRLYYAQYSMRHFGAHNRSCNDLMRMVQGGLRPSTMTTSTSIRKQRHRCGQLQECLVMARMAQLGSRLASLGSLRPSLAFFRGGIGRRRATGAGGVPVHTSFEGLDPLQEGKEGLLHARWGLVPILRRDAESIRQGNRIKPKEIAYDAISSYLVSFLHHTMAGASGEKYRLRGLHDISYPVITDDFTSLKVFSSSDREGVLYWTNGSVTPHSTSPEQTPAWDEALSMSTYLSLGGRARSTDDAPRPFLQQNHLPALRVHRVRP